MSFPTRPVLPLLTFLVLTPLLFAQAPAAPAPGPAVKTAEQVFQNIQVFKGKPANELLPTMTFIASSLGVRCTFCHTLPAFSADTQPTKQRARQMIQMVFSINQSTFNGRNNVNCYTCHQGHTRPDGTLTLAADATPGAPGPEGPGNPGGPGSGFGPGGRGGPGGPGPGRQGPPADQPSAQQILDKYQQALGGAAALTAIQSETVTQTQAGGFGGPAAQTLMRANGEFMLSEGANSKSGFDGTNYWSWTERSGRALVTTDQIGQMQIERQLYPAAGLDPSQARVMGQQSVDGHTAYVLFVRSANGADRYYFDADSGLLFRIDTGTPTFLGELPLEVDFSDYRAVNNVKLPFDLKWRTHDRGWEQTVSAIQLNPAVDASTFQEPAGPDAPAFPMMPMPPPGGRGGPPPAP